MADVPVPGARPGSALEIDLPLVAPRRPGEYLIETDAKTAGTRQPRRSQIGSESGRVQPSEHLRYAYIPRIFVTVATRLIATM